jgi:hypothetical protein
MAESYIPLSMECFYSRPLSKYRDLVQYVDGKSPLHAKQARRIMVGERHVVYLSIIECVWTEHGCAELIEIMALEKLGPSLEEDMLNNPSKTKKDVERARR